MIYADTKINKLSKVIGVLNRLKDILPLRILVNLYNSMILPYFNYCIIVWGNCASYLRQKLFLLQKKSRQGNNKLIL